MTERRPPARTPGPPLAAALLVLCALILPPAPVPNASAREDAEIGTLLARCPELTYATNPAYPPYDWALSGEAYEGASIELLAMILPPGVKAKPVVYPWKRSLLLAERGEIDLLLSLRITPERLRYLVFTTSPAFPNPIVLFVREDRRFPFTSWDALKGRTGGVSMGDTFGGGFDEFWQAHLLMEEAPTLHQNFRKLELGRIDYFVTGRYAGLAELGSHHFEHPIVELAPPITDAEIHFAFSRSSPCRCLLDYMSGRLHELDQQGVPDALLRKHLRLYLAQPHPE